jgi:hypothetical protein
MYCFEGVEDFALAVADDRVVLQEVDGGDLIDAGVVGWEGGLQVDVLCVEQEVLFLDLDEAEDEAGIADVVFVGEGVVVVDVW